MQVAIGAIIAGKYELERPLARGGMGSVWVARHVKLGSRLAVKFLDPRFAASPSFIDRFEREARAAAALQSPNVVHVQDYGVEETTPYLVMELLQGEDLGTRLRRLGRLSLPETARILTQVGKALRKAHEAGIVHRDLKPANLFLTRIDDEEVAKVLDFGIAKETVNAVGAETKTGEVMGSPHYMSPEQARADKGIDHRADLWSLGVILYRAVTGDLPFPGDVLGAILSRILVDPVPPVATVAPDLPASLDFFFAKAMAKSKELRFQSVRELVAAFVEIAGDGRASLTSHTSLSTSSPDIHAPIAVPDSPNASPHPSSASASLSGLPTIPLAIVGEPVPVPSGDSSSTLTTANMARDPGVRSQRSTASWLTAGALTLLVVGGGVYGWSRTRGEAGSPQDAAQPTPPPAGSEPVVDPPTKELPLPPSSQSSGPAPVLPPPTGRTIPPDASSAASSVAVSVPSAAPAASAAAPMASTAPAVSARKASSPAQRPPQSLQNENPAEGGNWGF